MTFTKKEFVSPGVALAEPTAAKELTVVPIALVGKGNVGRAFLRQLVAAHPTFLRRGVDLRVTAVVGRTGMVSASEGVDLAALSEIAEGGVTGARASAGSLGWERVTSAIAEASSRGQVVVDATAEDNADAHAAWLERGWSVVTANKHPLTSSLAQYDAMTEARRNGRAQYRYEATAGAGLPVIAALLDMLATGDEILEISGAVSGTLGYLCSACEEGLPFAQAVAEAKRLGFTEPDPRQDLSGADVARKALILARLMGVRQELADIRTESLVPEALADVDAAAFMSGLAAHGEEIDRRFRDAVGRGKALRYALTVRPDGISVGLEEFPVGVGLGSLKGPENMFVIRTRRYDANPLIIRGPGAGAEVTAAGVFSDVLRTIPGETPRDRI